MITLRLVKIQRVEGGGGEQLDREAFRSEEKVRVEHALPARRFALSSFCESVEGGSPKTGGGGMKINSRRASMQQHANLMTAQSPRFSAHFDLKISQITTCRFVLCKYLKKRWKKV